jgi:glycosyltransferase involved in cell wall biosynthesis
VLWKNKSRACERPTCFSCSLISGIPPQLWRYTRLLERAVDNIDALLAPSEYIAKRHREAGFKRPIRVLPLFSGIEPKSSPARQSARPRFLYVGRLTRSKGIVQLLEEFTSLPHYDLRVAGGGELREELERRFTSYSHISFLGRIPQSALIDEYQAATALIFPSLAPETFGLSIVEAFACGTPVVVHDAGGCREPVEATGGGLIYRTSDEFRAALFRLVQDRELRDTLGQRGREGFFRLYTLDCHLENYLGLVGSVYCKRHLQ